MSTDPASRCTQLLNQLGSSECATNAELMEMVHAELHRLAEIQMRSQASSHTLQPTALVNEAWIRLVDQEHARYGSRSHFFALASKVMRSILVDHARRKQAQKRAGSGVRVTLHEEAAVQAGPDLDVLTVDEALTSLAEEDPELARIVELRVFGGLSAPEAAEVVGMPLRSLERAYQVARLWLARHFENAAPDTA